MTCTCSSRSPQRHSLSVRLAAAVGLLVLLGSARADGQGVCERTAAVRDEILKSLGSTDCGSVTGAQLAGIQRLRPRGVTRLQPNDFRDLGNLQELDLAENELTSLPPGIFRGLSQLHELRLSFNKLTALPSDVFSGLSRLKLLLLGVNDLTVLPGRVFAGLSSLEGLYLDRNSLSGLPVGLFSDLGSMRTLDLSSNDLQSISAGLFDEMPELRFLHLSGNRLEELPSGLLSALSNLESLEVWDNRLSAFPEDLLAGMARVERLYLSTNRLGQLPAGAFARLPSLKYLRVRDNGLEELPARVFRNSYKLLELDLQGNDLRVLPEGVFDPLRSLETLRLQGNPGVGFPVPVRFERTRLKPDGSMDLKVRRIAAVRITLEVQLEASGGTLSAPTVTIPFNKKRSEVVTWKPNSPSASVVAEPEFVTGADFYADGWENTEGTIRFDQLPPVTIGSCAGLEDDLTAVCVRGGRFLFRVDWRSQYDGSEGSGTMRQLTEESAVATFFDEENVELVFKLLDGRGLNRHFWVFYGALSDVEYTLSVTDRETGEFREYRNPPGEICGRGDTKAFAAGSGAASLSASDLADRVAASQNGDCPSGALCLQDGRFQVTATWSNPAKGETGVGTPIPDTDSAGYMWFFSPGNIELVLKVLDGRWFNDSWWVYASALTDVDYTITVLDSHTGASRTYTNNPARPFCGFGDIGAFPE